MTIISLTTAGKYIAATIRARLKHPAVIRHWHKPSPFAEKMRQVFTRGESTVFIGSAAIVMRTLAPVLGDKHKDPPVVVIDERGRHVIPLLSGHQGGANRLAADIALVLDADCVITSRTPYLGFVDVIGVGCERNCPRSDIEYLFADILKKHRRVFPQALASVELKKDETAVLEFAHDHDLETQFYHAATLASFNDRVTRKSAYLLGLLGCHNVCETAAMAHAHALSGRQPRIIVSKQIHRQATMAVARSWLP